MRAFATCHDRDQHCAPLANVIAPQASIPRLLESNAAFDEQRAPSFETHRRAFRRSRIPLTHWRRADVAFVKETFIACFKTILRFDESSGDRLVVRKFGTSRSIIHRSRALEVFRYQITRD
jgi:hypothetical protein